MSSRLEVVGGPGALAAAAAAEFFRLGADAIRGRGAFRVALAGGTTPRAAYERVAESAPGGPLDWKRVHLFWGDERMVAPDDPRSNYGMAREALVSRVPIPPENVHPIPSDEANPEGAAARYEETLRREFAHDRVAAPRFDLVMLGVGGDGHTASLFPGSPALDETKRLATATRHPDSGEPRVTLTLPVINNAAAIIVLVSGKEKSAVLQRVVRGAAGPGEKGRPRLPVERLQPRAGTLLWLADEDAAPWAPSGSTGPNT